MASDSHTLREIKDFVFKHPPQNGNNKELFQELFQKIASSRMGGITAGHLTGFRSKGNKSIKKLQKMLAWDILNFLLGWIKSENLTEECQGIIIGILNGAEVMDEEDLSDLADGLERCGFNELIRHWAERQLALALALTRS